MAEFKLAQPPLTEAVCEVRFKAGKQWDGTAPGLVYSQMKNTLLKRRALTRFDVAPPSSERPAPLLEMEAMARFNMAAITHENQPSSANTRRQRKRSRRSIAFVRRGTDRYAGFGA
jgi:hypothetical protein